MDEKIEISKVETLTKMIPEVILLGINLEAMGVIEKSEFVGLAEFSQLALRALVPFKGKSDELKDGWNHNANMMRLDLALELGNRILGIYKHEIVENLGSTLDSVFNGIEDVKNNILFFEPITSVKIESLIDDEPWA